MAVVGALERVEEVEPDAGKGTAVIDVGVDGTYRGVSVPSGGGWRRRSSTAGDSLRWDIEGE